MLWRGLVLLLALAALAGTPAPAQTPTAPVIHVSLVAEPESVVPGQPFWVAVRFQMEEGWHIYWTNPGDSGSPPQVEWRLPAGFQAGELQWPHPARLVTKYSTDYGYAGQMMLLASIRAPANLAPSGRPSLAAIVKYVVCREVCIPGKTEVSLPLPVKSAAPTPSNPLFAEARKRLPQPTPARWRLWAREERNDFVLSLKTGQSTAHAEFFPLEEQQIENAAPQPPRAQPRGVRLRLRKSEHLLKPIAILKGVIVFSPGKAYLIEVPVSGAASGSRAKAPKKKTDQGGPI